MWVALTVGLILIGQAVAQDLPPGVLLLSRIKRHVKEELQRQPNVICLETVQRKHKSARGKMAPGALGLHFAADVEQGKHSNTGGVRHSGSPWFILGRSGNIRCDTAGIECRQYSDYAACYRSEDEHQPCANTAQRQLRCPVTGIRRVPDGKELWPD